MVYRENLEAKKARLQKQAAKLRLQPPRLSGVDEWLMNRTHYAQLSVFNTSLQYESNPK